MGRAPCCDKANVKKGPWSPEEDAKLKEYIEKNGTGGNWIALPQKIGLKRCGKSCRLRWLNYLRPNIKHGGFTEEEDNIICSLYISIGSRWSIIAAQLPGRTDNDIKNYWNTRLKKKLLGRRKQSNRLSSSVHDHHQKDINIIGNNTEENPHSLSNLSNSALERLQLHMQLQNPFSNFYNNHPSLWPKLNPLQIQNVPLIQEISPPSTTQLGLGQNHLGFLHAQQECSKIPPPGRRNDDDLEELSNNMMAAAATKSSSNVSELLLLQESSSSGGGINNINQPNISTLITQAEIDNFLNMTKSGDFEIINDDDDASRDNNNLIMWWSNENIDTNSASSNSWESNSLLHHQSDQGIFGQDYSVLGYSTNL